MIILAHRAQDVKEPIPQRFGVEIDVYNHGGQALMGHSPVECADSSLSWWIYEDLNIHGEERPIYAINIKSDGLENEIGKLLNARRNIAQKCFVFDGSYPTMRAFSKNFVPVAERISEEEPYRGHSHIIWLDRWDWQDGDKEVKPPLIQLSTYKRTEIYAVSPELHRPNCPPGYRQFWWRHFFRIGVAGICTDYWLECEQYVQQLEREREEGRPI